METWQVFLLLKLLLSGRIEWMEEGGPVVFIWH